MTSLLQSGDTYCRDFQEPVNCLSLLNSEEAMRVMAIELSVPLLIKAAGDTA